MLEQKDITKIIDLLQKDKDVILSYQKSKNKLIIKTLEVKKVN